MEAKQVLQVDFVCLLLNGIELTKNRKLTDQRGIVAKVSKESHVNQYGMSIELTGEYKGKASAKKKKKKACSCC